MHPTTPSIFPEPAASSTRRTAAGVKADRRSPAGLGLDTGEDRRTLATAGTANTQVTFIPITCIMPMTARCASATNPVEAGTASVIPPRMTPAAMSDRHLRAETTSRMLPTSVHGPRSARAQGTDAEFVLSMRGGAGCVVLDSGYGPERVPQL